MRAVGLKKLKNGLSEYVRLAASCETVLVTDGDKVVAELRAPQEGRRSSVANDALLADIVVKGWLTPPLIAHQGPPPRRPVGSALAILGELDQDRADRSKPQ